MRIWHWGIATSLLLALSAYAQQPGVDLSPSHATAQTPDSTSPSQAFSPGQLDPQPPIPVRQAGAASARTVYSSRPAPTVDQVVNRAVEREHALMEMLKTRTPLVETYLQNLKFLPQGGSVPVEDHYFLGRMDLDDTIDRTDYLKEKSMQTRLLGGFQRLYKIQYRPLGFSWMIYADRTDFDREHYNFRFAHREFLGDVRCLVFAVSPKKNSGKGRFVGRIWVEDQDYNIVRLNGTYEPRPRNAYFFHMDSWRLNLVPGYWVPAYIYSEEGDFSYGSKDKLAFKAQSRIWGYDLKNGDKADELTQVLVDSVKDESAAAADASPLQAQREWQQQAEDNVIDRLQKCGLLAPPGEVDKVLDTVVTNLEVTNNISLPRPVRARV